MTGESKLTIIRIIHTAVWLFFSYVIFYALYAAVTNQIDTKIWIAYALIGLEVIVLLLFKFICPLTLIARRFSDSQKDNFDIYLPNWLARYNKLIYTVIVSVALVITIYRISPH